MVKSDRFRWRRPSWTRPFVVEPVNFNNINQKTKRRPPYSAICLVIMCVAGFAIQLAMTTQVRYASWVTALWAIATLATLIQRPRTASVFLTLVFAMTVPIQLSILSARWNIREPDLIAILTAVSTVLSLSALVIVVNMPLRDPSLSKAEISAAFSLPTNLLRSPEDNLTLWQWMSVSWMSPLIGVGVQRQLHDEDVWLLSYEFQHRQLHDAFRELRGTVIRRLLRANCIDIMILSSLAIVEVAANYSAPVLLQYLLKGMEIINFNKRPAITFAMLTLAVRLIAAQTGVFSLWFARRCYERSRGEMITMLYEKTLNRKIVGATTKTEETSQDEEDSTASEIETDMLTEQRMDASENTRLLNGSIEVPADVRSPESNFMINLRKFKTLFTSKEILEQEEKLPASMGKILNMMRNDVYEVAQRFWELQNLITKPLGLIISLALVWRLLGWPCLFAVAVVLISQLITYFLARKLISWERVRRKATDTKLQQISQYVEAIRHLRWYGWHPTWLTGIMEARQKELNLRIITSLWNIAIRFVTTYASGLLPVAAFYAYTAIAGQQLRVDVAFPALQLFAMLQNNLRELPTLITVILNARVAVGRIEDFMNEPDKADINKVTEYSHDKLEVQNASFAWPGISNNVLQNLTLSFPKGLTLVFGQVGSGKTALLQALLGELDLRGGELVRPNAPVGYCAQTPWLQSMSIRENIVFTSPYDDSRYKQTLDACALTTDLASFKHGDLSSIGENGIGLSGGQKARVALARAVYSQSNILLLDDPLSALDQQTAEWIVKKCLTGNLLKDRTTILVTHRTDLCKGLAEQLVEIKNGTARVFKDESAAIDELTLTNTTSHPHHASTEQAEATEAAAVPEKFVEEEHRAHGSVQVAVYWEYVKTGRLRWWLLFILSVVISQLLLASESWFLKEWGEAYNRGKEQLFAILLFDARVHLMKTPLAGLFDRFPDPATHIEPWLIGFLIIVIGEAVALLISRCLMLVVTYSAGRRMFKTIMIRISNAPFRFYDITPVGRLMNRLTSDVGTVDGPISDKLVIVAFQSIAWITSVVVIASVTPLFLVFSLALTAAYVLIFLRFLPASQSLRRLEMVSLSPLMSNFGALLHGLMTVRAFCAQPQFQSRVIIVTDAFQKMDHFYWSLQSWLMYRFDMLSGCSTFLLTLLAIFSNLSSGLTAFVLIAAGKFVESTHSLCKEYGELQLEFVSVERVVELMDLDQEPAGTTDPPASWPRYGSSIAFENTTIHYSPTLPPALQDISLTLAGGTTTAVIGRTGSGKSTLALALLATVPPSSGRILIDGIDISHVSKQKLRERITFLAQEPVLFPGSMRHNLDPLHEHSDADCAAVLARACANQNFSLDTEIESGGRNLSQGQRQLVGLARAILRRSAVVIMDEATASVDLDTAWEVQRLLREEMKGSTVLCIAHRASAVRDAEGVVRLEAGRVKEVEGSVRLGEDDYRNVERGHVDE